MKIPTKKEYEKSLTNIAPLFMLMEAIERLKNGNDSEIEHHIGLIETYESIYYPIEHMEESYDDLMKIMEGEK
ncbi:hypothetical protein KKE60_06610 [Patescibacteria group bacterium]|nr:hypothetical protein [Patescibacteria group bacterium]